VTARARKLEARISVRVDEDLEERVERVARELAARSQIPVRVTVADAARVLLELGLEAHAAACAPMGNTGYQRPATGRNRAR
jgi:enoyl-CoA hydratase/carnithine racemase